MRTALKWTVGLILALVVALALFVAFGLSLLKGPLTRAVSEATGRELVIEGDLRAVWSWVHPRLRAEEVTFANAEWGKADHLFQAKAVEASLRLLPLLAGRIEVPEAHLEGAQLNLEIDAEGRKNWVLGKQEDRKDRRSRFHVQYLSLEESALNYADAVRDIHLQTDLRTNEEGVLFVSEGRYRGAPAAAMGQAGPVLSLRDTDRPFPLKGEAKIGASLIKVDGRITELIGLRGIDAEIALAGPSLEELYDVFGIAFPATKAYRTSGRLLRSGDRVRYEDFTGKIGESDIAGTIEVATDGERPFMRGELTSKVLNLADLGALVGTDRRRDKKGVLPDMPFSPARWASVDADVRIRAGTIKRPEQLPIEALSAHILMKDRVLTLEPLEFRIAGGKFAGPVRLDGSGEVIRADLRMRVQRLKLAELFPTLEQNRGSVGNISGLVELTGRGNSVSRMLGTADGKVGVFMDGGRISRLMMELAALDLWDVARLKLKGDEQIAVRCAIADFAVKNGVMETNAFVFDTAVVLVEGGGAVNLRTEEMDLRLNPKPKDSSIASLNTPLYVRGSFGSPEVSPDVGKLAARGAGALVLGIINPLLAVLPLFKEGDPENSNCSALIAQAAAPKKKK